MTVIANGVRSSAPWPSPSAMGNNPSTVVAVVITMGRNRTAAASCIAGRGSKPRCRHWLA